MLKSLKSTWQLNIYKLMVLLLEGSNTSDETLYFATTENDSFNEKGGFFYSVNSNNGDIIFKIPIAEV